MLDHIKNFLHRNSHVQLVLVMLRCCSFELLFPSSKEKHSSLLLLIKKKVKLSHIHITIAKTLMFQLGLPLIFYTSLGRYHTMDKVLKALG
jgi:ABC-type dipeptide/oligopeptide/nickel transport system permease component